jgi:hypothetical protein
MTPMICGSVRSGEHFLVFLDRPDEVIIVDILHPVAICRVTLLLWRRSRAKTSEQPHNPAALVRFTRNLSRLRW